MSDNLDMHRAKAKSIPSGHIAGLLFALLLAGCAGLDKAPAAAAGQKGITQDVTVAPIPLVVPVPEAAPVLSTIATQPISETPLVATPIDPIVTQPSSPKLAGEPVAKIAAPTARITAKVVTSSVPALPPANSAPSIVPKPASSPTLDLKSLEARLKDTQAIGVFTKLALKNQVNDLLEQFRAYYQGRLKVTLAELRRPYEMLLQKVLALLQDGDPPLAGAIVASREAIWGILADPAKFATI